MRIDDDSRRDSECRAEHHVRRLAADAWQGNQLVQRSRQFAAELRDQALSHADQIGRFGSEETGGLDELLDIRLLRGGEIGGRRILGKQRGRDHVDPLVGALRGKDRRREQLKRAVVVQSTDRRGVSLSQRVSDFEGLLLSVNNSGRTIGLGHVTLCQFESCCWTWGFRRR